MKRMKLEKSKTLKKYIEQLEHNFDCTTWLNNCPNKQSGWLNFICCHRFDEKQVLTFITLLLEKTNIDINRVDVNGNFIKNALCSNYSEDFMIQLFKLAYQRGNFNINYRDEVSGDTVIHTAIKSNHYEGNIAPLLKLANQMGFDPNIKNKYGKTVLDVALNSNCKYELDSDDLIEVKNLIEIQQEKIKLVKAKEKLLLIQEQVEQILKPLEEEEREEIVTSLCKTYCKK